MGVSAPWTNTGGGGGIPVNNGWAAPRCGERGGDVNSPFFSSSGPGPHYITGFCWTGTRRTGLRQAGTVKSLWCQPLKEMLKWDFLLKMSVNAAHVSGYLFNRHQKSRSCRAILHKVTLALSWKTTFFSPQLIQDITVQWHLPHPAEIPCLSAAGHMNSLTPYHPKQQSWMTLATATQHPNHYSTPSSLGALRLTASPYFTINPRAYLTDNSWLGVFSGHWPLSSTFLYFQHLMSSSYPPSLFPPLSPALPHRLQREAPADEMWGKKNDSLWLQSCRSTELFWP